MSKTEKLFLGPTVSGFHSNFFHTVSELSYFLNDIKIRGERKNSSKRRSFTLSLFFPGWNEMLRFWAFGKDVYSTLNKTEVYFKMKHHLKLLRKRPNKKHLHFFQIPFPIFLLLFFFFPLNWNKSLWSAWIHKTFQSTDLYNFSGKNLVFASSLLPSVATSQEAETKQSRGEMSGLSRGQGCSRAVWSTLSSGTHTPAHGYPPARPGSRRFKMSFIPLGGGWMRCEHPALSCLYF